MPALLQLTNVTKRYVAANGANSLPVLNGISLEAAHGETLAIVGPSGSGKSTLLQSIGTLDKPTSGEVLLDGKNIAALGDLELAAVRNQQIGFVFQSHYLLPQCTVWENVLVPTLAHSRSEIRNPKSETATARAERLLKRVGLGERFQHRP